MIVLCLAASHRIGLGHLFRMLNLSERLTRRLLPHLFVINDEPVAKQLLAERGKAYRVADLSDLDSGWELELIRSHAVRLWVNDRLATDLRHAERVRKAGAKLVSFDDLGSGSAAADLHIAALPCLAASPLAGARVVTGLDYLVLNPELASCRRERRAGGDLSLLVTLGGSDTYGVTVKVVELLARRGTRCTVVAGPSFAHHEALRRAAGPQATVKKGVASLAREFLDHDLAVTAGGITPFEANASGLPCIVVATEAHEVPNGRFLDRLGSSLYAGEYRELSGEWFDLDLDLNAMSRRGLAAFCADGAANVCRLLEGLL